MQGSWPDGPWKQSVESREGPLSLLVIFRVVFRICLGLFADLLMKNEGILCIGIRHEPAVFFFLT